jgi:hypothetical protein
VRTRRPALTFGAHLAAVGLAGSAAARARRSSPSGLRVCPLGMQARPSTGVDNRVLLPLASRTSGGAEIPRGHQSVPNGFCIYRTGGPPCSAVSADIHASHPDSPTASCSRDPCARRPDARAGGRRACRSPWSARC